MVLVYKGSIAGSKTFLRRYELTEDISLYDLNIFLQNDMGFSPDQMVMFRGYDDRGRVKSEYCLFDLGDGAMDAVSIADTLEKEEQTIEWVYNLKNNRGIVLSFEGETETQRRVSYPRLIEEKGQNPQQFSKTYSDEADEFLDDVSSSDDLYEEEELPEGVEEA